MTVGPGRFVLANQVLINSRLVDVDAAETELLAAAPVLDLDVATIRAWAARSRGTPLTDRDPGDSFSFTGSPPGYLTVQVEARRDKGVLEVPDEVIVNWTWTWDVQQQPAAP